MKQIDYNDEIRNRSDQRGTQAMRKFSQNLTENCLDILSAIKAHVTVRIFQRFNRCEVSKSLRVSINRRNSQQLGNDLICTNATSQAELDSILTDESFYELNTEFGPAVGRLLLGLNPWTSGHGVCTGGDLTIANWEASRTITSWMREAA